MTLLRLLLTAVPICSGLAVLIGVGWTAADSGTPRPDHHDPKDEQ